MFRWYKDAEVCYAYLADVSHPVYLDGKRSALSRSKWFTRGWTLQELIAPSNEIFFSSSWTRLGSKSELIKHLSTITGIDEKVLISGNTHSASIAQRMSWASKRRTTRTEDMAYCLLGIFDVNMPLLYGEGEKAFLRLQQELIKVSQDQSLFAWENSAVEAASSKDKQRRHNNFGLFASSPAHFINSGNIKPFRPGPGNEPYHMTSKGLCIRLPIIFKAYHGFVALLNCNDEGSRLGFKGIGLGVLNDEVFSRDVSGDSSKLFSIALHEVTTAKERTIYVQEKEIYNEAPYWKSFHVDSSFIIPSSVAVDMHSYTLHEVYPAHVWRKEDNIILYQSEAIGVVLFKDPKNRGFIIVLGMTRDASQIDYLRVICLEILQYDGQVLKDIHSQWRAKKKSQWEQDTISVFRQPGGRKERIQVNVKRMVLMGTYMYPVDIKLSSVP
jgi:hypothetical protein